jgi:hypothetical protein
MAERSKSIDALYRDIRAVWPGVLIYWIGDPAHASRVSDHNPDDTAGVRAAQTDADTLQEVRALDVMLGPAFSAGNASALVNALKQSPRLDYVIYNGAIWSRRYGWTTQPYNDGDPHTTHVHISGWAGDDANGADWPAVLALGDAMALRDDRDFAAMMYRVQGLMALHETITLFLPGGETREEENQLAVRLRLIEEVQTALVESVAGLANLVAEIDGSPDGTGPTPAQIAEEIGTRLSNG